MSENLSLDDFKFEFDKYYSSNDKSHGDLHILRVIGTAEIIMKSLSNNPRDYDYDIVLTACVLHDICRLTEVDDHALEGSILARNILEERKILKPYQIDKVCSAIETHRYSSKIKPTCIEGFILQDSDRMDSLGPVGITRAIEYSLNHGIPIFDPNIKPKQIYEGNSSTAINNIIEKQSKIKIDNFHFSKSKELAKEYSNFTKLFLKLYLKSYNK